MSLANCTYLSPFLSISTFECIFLRSFFSFPLFFLFPSSRVASRGLSGDRGRSRFQRTYPCGPTPQHDTSRIKSSDRSQRVDFKIRIKTADLRERRFANVEYHRTRLLVFPALPMSFTPGSFTTRLSSLSTMDSRPRFPPLRVSRQPQFRIPR